VKPSDPKARIPYLLERRGFMGMIAGGLLVAPLVAEGQSARVARMAYWRLLPPGPSSGSIRESTNRSPRTLHAVISRQRGKVRLER